MLLTLYRSVATLTDRKCADNIVVLVKFLSEIVTSGLHKRHIIVGFLITIATAARISWLKFIRAAANRSFTVNIKNLSIMQVRHHTHILSCTRSIASMAPSLLVSIHTVYSEVDICMQISCHVPLISICSSVSKMLTHQQVRHCT